MRNTYLKISGGLSFFLITLLSSSANAVSVAANSVGNLPAVLVESSAVDYDGNVNFWSLNDSGGDKIYSVDGSGHLLRTLNITNSQCRNWEDMTHDLSFTHMYIGDFGNNACDRTNLRIFRIPYPSSVSGTSVAADEIDFTYPDQHHIPSAWLNFDVESFIHFQGKLFLFTKADGSAVGYTKMYSLPDVPGTYVATLVDSFYTNDRTTSAAISPDESSLILISNTHIHIFRNFIGTDFFGGQHTQLSIAGGWTQKEGVSFSGNREIYLTDENTGAGNHLYYTDLSQWIPATVPINTSIEKINDDSPVLVFPIPANQFVNIQLKDVKGEKLSFSLFDLTGKNVYNAVFENSLLPMMIRTEDFTSGVYFYKIFADAKEIQTARLIISH